MDFNPDTWGTVAEWVGGTGTTLAFLATAYAITRDVKVRREAQARKVAYYFREVDRAPDEVRGRYTKWWIHEVHNLSDEPIYRVRHHRINQNGTRLPMYLRVREVLMPGESFAMREPDYPSKSRREVQFLDNSGRSWIRTLRGDLKELRPLLDWWKTYSDWRGRKANQEEWASIMSEVRRREGT
jgi:hypothetical protein